MRTKPGVDTLSFDDLYNNLKVFESDIKGSIASSSSTQNVVFVSSESTNRSSSYTDELKYSFFANQSSGPQLDHEDLEQVDEFDLEEMDLKWKVAMISIRLKKFYKKTGKRLQFDAKEPVRFDKTKVECFNCHNTGNFAREYRSKGNQESRRRDAGETLKMRKKKLSLMATALSSNIKVRYKLSRTESGLGYGNQIHEGVLSYEKEVLESVFDSRSSDVEDSHVNDRFAKNIPDFVPKPTVNEPTIVSKLKVWSDAPVIDEYESNSDDEYVIEPSKE
ncbi:hypothetical protein Tco_1256401 [Tanacetum coccineum]